MVAKLLWGRLYSTFRPCLLQITNNETEVFWAPCPAFLCLKLKLCPPTLPVNTISPTRPHDLTVAAAPYNFKRSKQSKKEIRKQPKVIPTGADEHSADRSLVYCAVLSWWYTWFSDIFHQTRNLFESEPLRCTKGNFLKYFYEHLDQLELIETQGLCIHAARILLNLTGLPLPHLLRQSWR